MEVAGSSDCKAYSMHQMRNLLQLAEDYCDGNMVPCKWLYRNKDKDYFDDILQFNRGIMEPVVKDGSGDLRNPINGELAGVFFTASVQKGSNCKPLKKSPYGSSRFQVPLEYLIDSDCYNLYFSDFYCVGTNFHYVILVVTEVDTVADQFCGDNLPLLDWDDNVFLTCDNDDNFEITDSTSCIIELFYAKVVNLRRALKMGEATLTDGIHQFPRRQELYKNTDCSTCNVYCSQNRTVFMTEKALKPRNAYSMHQMNKILCKAMEYCEGDMVLCHWLYRNKPKEYFDEILQRRRGIMSPVLKDRGGDPRNPIKDVLRAVFFTASVKRGSTKGKPMGKSPYGSSRFLAPVDYLIDPCRFNLYFADFYCSGSDFHYISLVVAEAGSEADVTCGDRLPMLGWNNNRFFTHDDDNGLFEVTDSDFCIIEVLLVNEVSISKALVEGGAILEHNLRTCGKVLLKDGGLDKNLECSTCNNVKPSWGKHRMQCDDEPDASDGSRSGYSEDEDLAY